MRDRSTIALQVAAATIAAASLPQSVWEGGAEPRPKPTPKPKRGKPTKAEKKAAKRARTRGVAPAAPTGMVPNYCNAEQCTCRMGFGYVACDQQPKWKAPSGVTEVPHG